MNRAKRTPKMSDIMAMTSFVMEDGEFRFMLDSICPGCSVRSNAPLQGGEVEKVIRSHSGMPVCVKVRCGSEGEEYVDYIPIDRISSFEHPREVYNLGDYDTWEETCAEMAEGGYVWDDERGCFYNKETGDEIV